LIDVQGVSTTIGLAIMGARPAADLRVAILNGDESLLKSIKASGRNSPSASWPISGAGC
jgi:Holliday junction resolvasome RuvABC DNA-binding subunit